MENHANKAVKLFESGCTCSQAVFVSYAEDLGMDIETAMKVSVALGGGMARMRETCGAVSAMALIAGLKYGGIDPTDVAAKSKALDAAKCLAEKFKEEHGSIVCKELLGLERNFSLKNYRARSLSVKLRNFLKHYRFKIRLYFRSLYLALSAGNVIGATHCTAGPFIQGCSARWATLL